MSRHRVREPLVHNFFWLHLAAENSLRKLELRKLVLHGARTRPLGNAELQLLEPLPNVLSTNVHDLCDELIG